MPMGVSTSLDTNGNEDMSAVSDGGKISSADMARQKIMVGQLELVRILADSKPDIHVHISDPDWGSGYVDAYLWETLELRTNAGGGTSTHVASLVTKGLIKFVTVRPTLLRRFFGARSNDYCYLTPLGRDAASKPADHLLEVLERDDYDRRYEPKGMWLRQIEGLPPRAD